MTANSILVRKFSLAGAAGLAAALLPLQSFALGTIAGTDILNTAEVSFEVGGNPQTVSSNTISLTVAEIIDGDITLLSGPVSTPADTTDRDILFVLTNTGNGNESFSLTLDNSVTGNDFDPILGTPAAIYFDTDNSGDFSPGDIAYDPGNNDPLLAPDESVQIIIVNDIPASLADGLIGQSELTVAANTITGTNNPGDLYPGDGDNGIDAVVGTSGANDLAIGEYVIADTSIDVVKTASVLDLFGGSDPLPGAEITYTITVTPSGTATISNAVVTDPIPANTSYIAESIRLNSNVISDAVDADEGTYATTPTPQVSVDLGDLTGASGVQTIEFKVTID